MWELKTAVPKQPDHVDQHSVDTWAKYQPSIGEVSTTTWPIYLPTVCQVSVEYRLSVSQVSVGYWSIHQPIWESVKCQLSKTWHIDWYSTDTRSTFEWYLTDIQRHLTDCWSIYMYWPTKCSTVFIPQCQPTVLEVNNNCLQTNFYREFYIIDFQYNYFIQKIKKIFIYFITSLWWGRRILPRSGSTTTVQIH